ncbi:MAG TPA: hypothetical protein VF952_00755 [Chloroflexia bacterium]
MDAAIIMRDMRDLNHRALCGEENGQAVFIEDIADPDGRIYRVAYRCAPDGSNATASLF